MCIFQLLHPGGDSNPRSSVPFMFSVRFFRQRNKSGSGQLKLLGHKIGNEMFPGTDVMIFKIFSPKISAKKLAFLTQNKAKLFKKMIITLVLEKNINFFAENWQKSQKIVIITSTPDE
jgi:hypothetical protein